MRHLPLLVVFLTACADDPANGSAGANHGDDTEAPHTPFHPGQTAVGNDAPVTTIQNPVGGEMFTAADTVSVLALVADGNGLSDIAEVSLVSSLDGELDLLEPNADGLVIASIGDLSVGEHILTVTVTDLTGEQGSDEVLVHIQ